MYSVSDKRLRTLVVDLVPRIDHDACRIVPTRLVDPAPADRENFLDRFRSLGLTDEREPLMQPAQRRHSFRPASCAPSVRRKTVCRCASRSASQGAIPAAGSRASSRRIANRAARKVEAKRIHPLRLTRTRVAGDERPEARYDRVVRSSTLGQPLVRTPASPLS
jgi:hypothetical protein